MERLKNKSISNVDGFIHAAQAKLTLNISPVSQILAVVDWMANLSDSPGKQLELTEDYLHSNLKFQNYLLRCLMQADSDTPEPPPVMDSRFKDSAWQQLPYNLLCQHFLLMEQWWQKASTGVPGVSEHHLNMVSFGIRQLLDVFSPANFLFTNPILMKWTQEQKGKNLARGFENFMEDLKRIRTNQPPVGVEEFKVGEKVAVTPGKVVLRNQLIELIQYSPATENVHAEPILIVPAWIMKYYILDLSPHNSLVKFLVNKGHTVFIVSWKNPDAEDRELGMEDYRELGIMAAVDAITKIVSGRRIHAVGYCIGGTLLTIAAAAMARDGDDRLKTMTLLAAQTDFTEAGEVMLFIDEKQVNYLEDIMWSKGYLDTKQMAGAFQLIRAYDLLWSWIIQSYLMGERRPMNDLMAWNADATRMPYRMHSDYLRHLFVDNDLFEGRYQVNGRNIVIRDIRVPTFIVGTIQDHVAPWRSVYKFHLTSDAESVTFILTTGGHNVGIISEPDHPRRTYQISTQPHGYKYTDPDHWMKETPKREGSWWIPWQKWLADYSGGQTPPPSMGAPQDGLPPLGNAPGTYVFL